MLPATLKARLSLLATMLVVVAAVMGAAGSWLLSSTTEAGGDIGQSQAAVAVGAGTALVVLVLGAIFGVSWVLRPLSGLASASREVSQGRHPDEALASVMLTGEAATIAQDIRALAVRLREIDASDRRFLMSISHELRTPLTAITGHAQLIEDVLGDDAEARGQSLGVIRREASRLERLVEDIVDLARLRSNRFTTATESVYLDELGEHLLAIFGDQDGMVVDGEFAHVLFHSDGQRILQILRNLVNNALRYAHTNVHVTGRRVGGHVRFAVVNDGEPIPENQREKIFEPFVGTKREGGMGLGLAIGRELAWALGGNLSCIARDDGAEFELVLPLEPPDFGR